MPSRGLTLSGRSRAPRASSLLLLSAPVAGIVRPREIPKDYLTAVPLRDLALEAQYAEIREALSRYREEAEASPQEGETKCGKCATINPEDRVHCECGNFLHSHRIFTCPSCTKVVPKDARDCDRCGAAFWSPVNPPAVSVTEGMVSEYLEGMERADFA